MCGNGICDIMTDKINVAVIGTGNMGKHHARVYSELEQAELVAVCDSDEQKAGEIAEKFGCSVYSDYIKMLDSEKIRAVSIAVPTKFHKDIALECIERGIHILIEKPIADTVENAQEIIDSAGVNDIRLMVGHIERFNPAVQKLKSMIDMGELGDVNTIVARRVGVYPPQIKDANVIIDLAIHDIDIFNYLLGRGPLKINVNSGRALVNHREDFADILLDYGGVNAFVQANWITPVKIRNLAVTGTGGYAELNYITQELILYKSTTRNIDNFNDVVEFGTPKRLVIDVEKAEPLKLELSNFLDCIAGEAQPVVTGEDALLALKNALDVKGDDDKDEDDRGSDEDD
jgi:UDP-N-acetylglucosamine 3-dehydrogenase